jgi:CheY-specific phosphatase CheX
MVDIRIATPKEKTSAIKIIGIDHKISHPNRSPNTVRMIMNTSKVGINLKKAITVAEIGNIIRGNAVLRIRRCPAVTDLTPPLRLLLTK